jgi:transaldolase
MRELVERVPGTAFWMDSLIDEDIRRGLDNGCSGVTTAPPITTLAIEAHETEARAELLEIWRDMPRATERDLLWEWTYRQAVEGAAQLLPRFDPEGPAGRFAIQADIFAYNDPDAMIAQGRKINSLGRNFFIKIPTTPAGLVAAEELLAAGLNVMNTGTSSVTQVLAACEAQERGLERRARRGGAGYVFHSIATQLALQDMCYRRHAASNGIGLSDAAASHGAIAVAKKSRALLRERGYDGVYMISNFATPEHFSEFVGGDLAITLPRRWQDWVDEHGFQGGARMDVPVDPAVIDELLAKIPFYRLAWEPGALDLADLGSYPPFCRTINFFTSTYERALRIVRDVMLPDPYAEHRPY